MNLTKHCVIMDFDHAYCKQDFYKNEEHSWVDCSSLQGTNCYCDEEARKKLRELIRPYPMEGLHYIDSGNYHYVTELWLEKAQEPFVLVVFDHHTDMQPSMFDQLLSCGCWVKQVIDTNPYVKKVFIIGAKEELKQKIPKAYLDKVICYSEKTCVHEELWQKYLDEYEKVPVYISIDKDILEPCDAITNWDQGTMTIQELESILRHIIQRHHIAGIDICGEYAEMDSIAQMILASEVNNKVNEELYQVISVALEG